MECLNFSMQGLDHSEFTRAFVAAFSQPLEIHPLSLLKILRLHQSRSPHELKVRVKKTRARKWTAYCRSDET